MGLFNGPGVENKFRIQNLTLVRFRLEFIEQKTKINFVLIVRKLALPIRKRLVEVMVNELIK